MKGKVITEWSTRRDGVILIVTATRWAARGQFTATRRLHARLAAGMEIGCQRRLIAGMQQELQQAEWYGVPDAARRRPSVDGKKHKWRAKPRRT